MRTATITPAGSDFKGQVHFVVLDENGAVFAKGGPVEKTIAKEEIKKADAVVLRMLGGHPVPEEFAIARKDGVITVKSAAKNRKAVLTQKGRNKWNVVFHDDAKDFSAPAAGVEPLKGSGHAAAVLAALNYVGGA